MDYLLQARQISNEDAQLILSKVPQPIHVDPAPVPPTTTALVQPGSSLQLTTLPTPILNSNVQPAASPPAQPPHPTYLTHPTPPAAAKRAVPAPPKKVQARALWDYNIDGDVRGPVFRLAPLSLRIPRPYALQSPSEPIPIAMTFSKYTHTSITISPRSPCALPVHLPVPLVHTHTSAHARESPILTLFPPPDRNQKT